MRIENYIQVQQLYQSRRINQSQKSVAVSNTDQIQISTLGKDIQTAKAAVAGSPDIREELTTSLKTKIQNGTYQVKSSDFADKLLKKYNEMR